MPTVALLQASAQDIQRPNKQERLESTIAEIRLCAKLGAKIVCTQELFLSPYFCQTEDSSYFEFAESIPGPTSSVLALLAKELNIVILASLFEKRLEGLYHNTVVVFDADGSLMGGYRKMHIPDDPDYYEKYYFTPGDMGYRVWHTKYAKIGVLICWDQWFPEAARALSLLGAEILFYPTAIGFQKSENNSSVSYENHQHQCEAWELIQRSHAIANGVYVCSVNRVGVEGNIHFWGQSFISDPFGVILKKASATHKETLIHEIDLNSIAKTRHAWPFLRDRRTDSYRTLLQTGPNDDLSFTVPLI